MGNYGSIVGIGFYNTVNDFYKAVAYSFCKFLVAFSEGRLYVCLTLEPTVEKGTFFVKLSGTSSVKLTEIVFD